MSTTTTKTLCLRIKDKHVPLLRRMAREVNTVWNYCNQANRDHWRKHRRHLTGFDLNRLCTGSSPAFDLIGDSSIQEVGQHYTSKRKASGKSRLRWRISDRKRRNYSLGWIPFKSRAAAFKNGAVRFAGRNFRIWDSYGLDAHTFARGYQIVHVVHEIASGINDERPKLHRLIGQRDFDVLLVNHKDRLTRFGFRWFEALAPFRIEVVNTAEEATHDLMEDLVAIITSFAARLYDKRRGRQKTQAAIEALKS